MGGAGPGIVTNYAGADVVKRGISLAFDFAQDERSLWKGPFSSRRSAWA